MLITTSATPVADTSLPRRPRTSRLRKAAEALGIAPRTAPSDPQAARPLLDRQFAVAGEVGNGLFARARERVLGVTRGLGSGWSAFMGGSAQERIKDEGAVQQAWQNFDRWDLDQNGFLSRQDLARLVADNKDVKTREAVSRLQSRLGVLEERSNDEKGDERQGISLKDLARHRSPGGLDRRVDNRTLANGDQLSERKTLKSGREIEVRQVVTRQGQTVSTLSRGSETLGDKTRTTTLETFPQDKREVTTSEIRDSKGLVARTRQETKVTEQGESTVIESMRDGKTARTEVSASKHADGTLHQTVKSFENGQPTGTVADKVETRRWANADDMDVDGLGGWVPWDNPQDLVNRLGDGPITQQKTERTRTDKDGKQTQETLITLRSADGKRELISSTIGGNATWTEKRDNGKGKIDSQIYFQGSENDTVVTRNTQENGYEVERTSARFQDHPGVKSGNVKKYAERTVKTKEVEARAALQDVSAMLGSTPEKLGELDSVKKFMSEHGSAAVKVRVVSNVEQLKLEKTEVEKFHEAIANSGMTGARVASSISSAYYSRDGSEATHTAVLEAPDGTRLVLGQQNQSVTTMSRESLLQMPKFDTKKTRGTVGARLESPGLEGAEKAHESFLLPSGQKVEDVDPKLNDEIEATKWGKTGGEILGKAAQRYTPRLATKAGGLAHAVPGLDGVTGLLSATSAAHDFANGNTMAGLRGSAGAMQDFGTMAAAANALRPASALGAAGTAGKLLTKVGFAGSVLGVGTGLARLSEGDAGGAFDITSGGATAWALLGGGPVAWTAGILSAAAGTTYDYYRETRIAEPRL